MWACLGVVALLGNVIASAFCCAPSFARKSEIFDPVLGAIPLCSSDLGTSGGKQPKGSKHHCPVCLSAPSKALAAAPLALPLAAPTFLYASAAGRDVFAIEGVLRLGGLGSRAPPFPV